MPGDVEYQSGSAKINMNEKSKKVLTFVATLMKDNPEVSKLRIEGHTDNAGEAKGFDNVKLSTERAQAVADWLAKNGVDPTHMIVKGYGSQHPLSPNDTPEHMALNRRTEFHVHEFSGVAVEAETYVAPPAPPAPPGKPAPPMPKK
jgi:outer membrane protein OmpA-like peptidoglycan-associated protein